MLPPGAAISGLSLRSGVTPHEVKSETDGLVEASLRPACGLVMVMEPDSLALMASISASFSFFVMVTVGIVWVASIVATYGFSTVSESPMMRAAGLEVSWVSPLTLASWVMSAPVALSEPPRSSRTMTWERSPGCSATSLLRAAASPIPA